MAAQDAGATVAGTVGEAGGLAATAMDWVVTKGPGLAVQFVIFLAILIIGFWIAKKLAATVKKLALKSPNVDETLASPRLQSSVLKPHLLSLFLVPQHWLSALRYKAHSAMLPLASC